MINLSQSSDLLLNHVLSCGVFKAIIKRTEDMKSKFSNVDFKTLEENTDKILKDSNNNKRNIPFDCMNLFQIFSHFVFIFSYYSYSSTDLLKSQLLPNLIPLLNIFLNFPIPQITINAIDTLSELFLSNNPYIDLILIDNFSQTLFSLTDNTNVSIVYTILQLFNTILYLKPKLFIYKNFGTDLLFCMNKIVKQNRDIIIDKLLIAIISSIGEDIDLTNQLVSNYFIRVCDQLLYLLSKLFESNDQKNKEFSLFQFKTIFSKYNFKQFLFLIKSFNLNKFIEQTLENSENENKKIVLEIIEHILNIISEIPNSSPFEIQAINSHFFKKQTNIIDILEKLCFMSPISDQNLSNIVNHLIERIGNKENTFDELTIIPMNNGLIYIFSPEINNFNFIF